MSMFCFVDTVEENEERMMIDPSSREDPKVKELLQVCTFSHFNMLSPTLMHCECALNI